MKRIIVQKSCIFLLIVSLTDPVAVFAQMTDLDRIQPRMPDISLSRGSTRGNDPLNKLSPALRLLYDQFVESRGRGDTDGVGGFTDRQLSEIFGISAGDSDPLVALEVTFTQKSDMLSASKEGATTIAKAGNVAYVVVGLEKLGAISNIKASPTLVS